MKASRESSSTSPILGAGAESDSGNPTQKKRPTFCVVPLPFVNIHEPFKSSTTEIMSLSSTAPTTTSGTRASRTQSFPFTLPPRAARTSSFFQSRSKAPSEESAPRPLPPTSLHLAGSEDPTSRRFSLTLSQRSMSEPATSPTSSSPSRPTYIRKAKRNSQGSGVMQCGRHSNDWLFGGFSVRETVKGMVRRDSGEFCR